MNKNRKGLALGAIFALVGSLLVSSPAQAADETAVVAFPKSGLETQTSILATEAFDLNFRFGNSVALSLRDATSPTMAGYGIVVTKPAGVTVSSTVTNAGFQTAATTTSDAASIAGTEFVTGFRSSGSPTVEIALPSRTSISAAVAITVTPFLDLDQDGVRDNGENLGTPIVLNFVPWSAMNAVLTLAEPFAGLEQITASFVVTAGTINWSMLGNFSIILNSTKDAAASATNSGAITATSVASATYASVSNVATGNYSVSYSIGTAKLTTSGTVQSVSATLLYAGTEIAKTTVAVTAVTIAGITMSPVVGPNLVANNATSANARFNSAFTLNAFAHTTSQTTSMAVARAFTVSAVGAGIELDVDSGVVIGGTTYTSSATLLKAGLTLAAGTNTVTISTFGQDYDASGESITFETSAQLIVDSYTVNLVQEALTVAYTATTQIVSAAGASRTFTVDITDQWGEDTARPDLRVKATVALGGSTSDAVYAAVAGSAATLTVAPTPATRTGSAVVTFTLQSYDYTTRAYVDGDTTTVNWDVYSYAAGTDGFVSRTVSISASISYGVALSYSSQAVAVTVVNSFSTVVVSAPGLIIQNADLPTQTASAALTVAANGKVANFKFTSALAGTYTVSFTTGTASTTSTVVVNPAAQDSGKTITFDTSAIGSGSTATITGTLADANGNPVNTSGSATIAVAYTGIGIAIGTLPTETDEDGEFSFTVLTGANDKGIATVTAVYAKSGAATAAADKITATQTITVGAEAVVTPPVGEKKLTVGTFNGYIAIYAKGYEGSKLSAKVAGKWLTVAELSSFQRVVRKTGAGYAIMVDLYIDGVLAQSSTTVTK